MSLKKFLVFSVIVHLCALFGIYLIPSPEEKKPADFFARLVSPEELGRPEVILPGKKSTPESPSPPVSEPPKLKRIIPKKRAIPDDEKPVVPGEGKDTGEPLSEGLTPRADQGITTGQELTREYIEKPGFSEDVEIFDEEVIGDIAKKDTSPSVKEPERDYSMTFDTKQYRYAGYMRKLKQRIESIWVYPPAARTRGIYGDLKIRFTIKKNGELGAVELVRTSGYKMLDDAAMRALKEGEPYWPLPDEWGVDSYTILGHFIYSLYGYYVR